MVGQKIITVLKEKHVIPEELELFSSERSAGKKITYFDKELTIKELKEDNIAKNYDFVLFATNKETVQLYYKSFLKRTDYLIDNSSMFRSAENIPLVAAGVNESILNGYRGVIANPNCSTLQIIMPLQVISKLFGLKKVIYTTYQAVSGAGNAGIETLRSQRNGANNLGVFEKKIDLNIIPSIGNYISKQNDLLNNYTEEEFKMVFETKKILNDRKIRISATCVRVPVFDGHCVSLHAELKKNLDLDLLAQKLNEHPHIVLRRDDIVTPLDIGESNDTYVSRLRYGLDNKSVTFWSTAHNVRIGAATNVVRILKYLSEKKK